MDQQNMFSDGKNVTGDTWYVDNYILLKDYYDRTISRIAARCVRKGNIAIEEYPYYAYILDVLEEITETGDYIVEHPNLYPYVEKKIAGGMATLKKNLKEFDTELQNNASPDMIKQDKDELQKMKQALGELDKSKDPTVGAGMSMDEVVEKLLKEQDNASKPNPGTPRQNPQAANPRPMPQRPLQQAQRPNMPQASRTNVQNQAQQPSQPKDSAMVRPPFTQSPSGSEEK